MPRRPDTDTGGAWRDGVEQISKDHGRGAGRWGFGATPVTPSPFRSRVAQHGENKSRVATITVVCREVFYCVTKYRLALCWGLWPHRVNRTQVPGSRSWYGTRQRGWALHLLGPGCWDHDRVFRHWAQGVIWGPRTGQGQVSSASRRCKDWFRVLKAEAKLDPRVSRVGC